MAYRRIPRSDQSHLAFPKHRRVSVNKSKKSKTPESTIQAMADLLLQTASIPYLRLPDGMFKSLHAARNISPRLKSWILFELGGFADNIAFLPIGKYKEVKFCIACHIENKSDVGRLHGKQKIRDKELGYNVCRTEADIRNAIKVFKEFHGVLTGMLKEEQCKEQK